MTNPTPNRASRPESAISPSDSDATTAAPATKRSAARFITPVLALVAAVGVGLLGGVLIGNSGSDSSAAAGQMGTRPDGATGDAPTGGMGGGMGGFTSGTVSSIDGDTITLELTDGSTVTVTATDDTTVTSTEESSVGALAEGDSLTVIGEADDDGNVAATSISEGASAMRGGGSFPGAPDDAGTDSAK